MDSSCIVRRAFLSCKSTVFFPISVFPQAHYLSMFDAVLMETWDLCWGVRFWCGNLLVGFAFYSRTKPTAHDIQY